MTCPIEGIDRTMVPMISRSSGKADTKRVTRIRRARRATMANAPACVSRTRPRRQSRTRSNRCGRTPPALRPARRTGRTETFRRRRSSGSALEIFTTGAGERSRNNPAKRLVCFGRDVVPLGERYCPSVGERSNSGPYRQAARSTRQRLSCQSRLKRPLQRDSDAGVGTRSGRAICVRRRFAPCAPRPRSGAAPSTTKVPSSDRRVDAAIPSRAEVDRQIDLVVQVRFADSPQLGLEDWPTRRRPADIEQGSEAVRIAYSVDPRSGAYLPARLRLRVVAPDFAIDGDTERLIEVPPYGTRDE